MIHPTAKMPEAVNRKYPLRNTTIQLSIPWVPQFTALQTDG